MKILIINHYAGSAHLGMEYRPYYLAQAWLAMGHDVRIVAASFSHLREKNIRFPMSRWDQKIDGIDYTWLKTPAYRGNGRGRVLNMLSFTALLYGQGNVLADQPRPDAVIASSTYPLDIYPAKKIANRAKALLAYEVHDLWPLTPMALGGISRRHPYIMLLQHAEDFACKYADRVISMLPKADDHLKLRGMAQEKFFYVPNGIKTDAWRENLTAVPNKLQDKVVSLHGDGHFIVGYTGAHGLSNSLDSLIIAASMLINQQISFILVGKGPKKEALQKKAVSLGAQNVHFFDPVSKDAIPGLLALCDALYIGWNQSPLYRFGISPNKLMDYMMAARPVIHAVDAGNDIVAESACGLSVAPEDPDAIANSVLRLREMSSEDRKIMGKRGKAYVLREHDYTVLARRFIKAISI